MKTQNATTVTASTSNPIPAQSTSPPLGTNWHQLESTDKLAGTWYHVALFPPIRTPFKP
jgi:hypothetical protein